ncbi:UNVERIFIED_CONTAM: hypothetical protein PYX00_010208 [Menopon gallinae]|uniref:Uncharacterized protein n=1 Tax=Menopon gallinae TaxID=328185 RepID=A0AAW2HEH2_9NEOP
MSCFSGVKLDNGDIPPLSSSCRPIAEIAEELSKAIAESSYQPSLPSPNVALTLQKWVNQNCKVSSRLLFRLFRKSSG